MFVGDSKYVLIAVRSDDVVVTNKADGRTYVYPIAISSDNRRYFTVRDEIFYIDE